MSRTLPADFEWPAVIDHVVDGRLLYVTDCWCRPGDCEGVGDDEPDDGGECRYCNLLDPDLPCPKDPDAYLPEPPRGRSRADELADEQVRLIAGLDRVFGGESK